MKGLEIGTSLYRNLDMAFNHILKKTSAHRRIAVKMDFTQENTLIRLNVRDEDGMEAEAIREVSFEFPRDPSRAREQIETHLCSTGNTPYQVARLTIRPQQPGYISISILNGIRRDVSGDSSPESGLKNIPAKQSSLHPTTSPTRQKHSIITPTS